MVWEQRVLLIVMTTRLVEQGRTKCGRYWPLELGAETRHGFFTVENLGVTQHDCYNVSQLLLTDTRTEQTRQVWYSMDGVSQWCVTMSHIQNRQLRHCVSQCHTYRTG